ncbi:MAG: hypothetical protein ACPGYV_08855 [Phycisphaeraceae bacterium]
MKKALSQLATLLIVTAIALLVWLYAEDANIEPYTEQTIRLQFQAPEGIDGRVTPGEPVTIRVDFDSSNGQFQQFDQAREEIVTVVLPLDPTLDLQTVEIDIRSQLESLVFSDLGINLTSVNPARAEVTFDKDVEVALEVEIEQDTGPIKLAAANFTEPEKFSTVRFTMPASRAAELGDAKVLARLTEDDVAALPKGTPQQITVPLVVPDAISSLPRSIAAVDLLVTVADDRDTIQIDRRPILLSYPSSINERYIVEVEEAGRFITAFELEGPREQIALLKEDPSSRAVWASVRLSNEEVDAAASNGGVITKAVDIIAPQGVVLASDVVRATIKVTPRQTPAP